jgi:hypothetical protein
MIKLVLCKGNTVFELKNKYDMPFPRLFKFFLTCALMLLFVQVKCVAQGYVFLGDAGPMGNDCIRLTYDSVYRTGIAWSEVKLSLDKYFRIEFDVFLGEDDLGADGITFVIHSDPRGFLSYGTFGEGIGYGRFNPAGGGISILPSVAVEFDTYYNRNQADPVGDHVALLVNGSSGHYFDLPVFQDDQLQLEDGYLHSFQFIWDPESNKVQVLLDGQTVINYGIDLRELFPVENGLIWGFTSSTGRKHNNQYFCLRRMAYRFDRDKNRTLVAEHSE